MESAKVLIAKVLIEKVYGDRVIRYFECPCAGPSVEIQTPICVTHKTIREAYKSAKYIRKMQIENKNSLEQARLVAYAHNTI